MMGPEGRGAPRPGGRPTGDLDGAGAAAGDGGSLEEQAYDAVLAWLLRGGARPGDVVPLRELARQLGMSRTSIRFAVGRLHEQQLVSYQPRVGFTVAIPAPADLYELFDLRQMCEVHAVRRFFDRGGALPLEIPRLAQAGLDLAGQIVADPEQYPAFYEADAQFHRAIVALGENGRLLEWYDRVSLRMLIARLGATVPLTEERFRRSAAEHLAIARAMQAGRAKAARRLLEDHIRRVRDQTVERIRRSGAAPPRPSWLGRGPSGRPA
jgi:DNA-binding GntR family transcriptional regulator